MVWNTERVFLRKSSVGLSIFYEFRNRQYFQVFSEIAAFRVKLVATKEKLTMKKIMFTIALTLALTAGIASPISAVAQVHTKPSPILNPTQDGPCPLDFCVTAQ